MTKRKTRNVVVTLNLRTSEPLRVMRDAVIWREAVQLFALDDDGSVAVQKVTAKIVDNK